MARKVVEVAPDSPQFHLRTLLTRPAATNQVWCTTKALLPLLPITVRTLGSMVDTFIADRLIRRSPTIAAKLKDRAQKHTVNALQDLQKVFFKIEWMGPAMVRSFERLGEVFVWSGFLITTIFEWLNKFLPHRSQRQNLERKLLKLRFFPADGYSAFMEIYLRAGRDFGYFTASEIHTRVVYAASSWLVSQEQRPRLLRVDPPLEPADLFTDIDSLYWANSSGSLLKITCIDQAHDDSQPARRWIVQIPGTDHLDPLSTPNPADAEANVLEALGVRSRYRAGVVAAIEAGIKTLCPRAITSDDPIMLVGHSLGGTVAAALSSPGAWHRNVTVAVTAGAPIGRSWPRLGTTVFALEHNQDVIPCLDGAGGSRPTTVVVVRRSLERPQKDPLYYAHFASTYAQTLKLVGASLSRRAKVAYEQVIAFLPRKEETARTVFVEIWQTVEPTAHLPAAERITLPTKQIQTKELEV